MATKSVAFFIFYKKYYCPTLKAIYNNIANGY